jgi:hypothetical protein
MQATKVPDNERMNFLPAMAGRQMLAVEFGVYNTAAMLTDGVYRGGYWEFFQADNGARYMAPQERPGEVYAESPNGYAAIVSNEAFGIVCTLFALSHTSFSANADPRISESFHALRDFASEHAEAADIFGLID